MVDLAIPRDQNFVSKENEKAIKYINIASAIRKEDKLK